MEFFTASAMHPRFDLPEDAMPRDNFALVARKALRGNNDPHRVRISADWTSIKAKVWDPSGPAPADWDVPVTDSDAFNPRVPSETAW
jgi:hypothetical protein